MAEANERIRTLRKALGLNMTDFASSIGFGQSGLSGIESSSRPVTERHIRLICGAYPQVNPDWLRTGEGDMFLPDGGRGDELDELCRQFGLMGDFAASTLRAYVRLSDEHRQMILDWLTAAADDFERRRKARTSGGDGQTADDAAPSSADADPDADFKRQVLEGRARHEAYMAAQRDAESKQAQ